MLGHQSRRLEFRFVVAMMVLTIRSVAAEDALESSVITKVADLLLVSHQLLVLLFSFIVTYGCRKVNQPLAKVPVLLLNIGKLLLSHGRI